MTTLVEDAGDIDDFCLPVFKIVLVGPSGAGKSSLVKRYFDEQFQHNGTATTIGIDFKHRLMSIHGNHCKVLVFDTAGQERLRALTGSYYRNAQAVILLYDVSRKDTFQRDMESWFAEVNEKAPETAVICLTAGKSDMFKDNTISSIVSNNTSSTSSTAPLLPAPAPAPTPLPTLVPVSEQEGRLMAEKHKVLFATTSAATGEGVRDVFAKVMDEYVQKWGLPDPPRHTRKLVQARSELERTNGWCC